VPKRLTSLISRRAVVALISALFALISCASMRGFTVDDALISVRYARHVAQGLGYVFNAFGVPTDGVTPLPWTFVLVPFATGSATTTLRFAKWIGSVAWVLASAALGADLAARSTSDRRTTLLVVWALLVLGLAFEVGAWAASGMETGLVTALATLAVVRRARPRQAAVLAGVVAAFRPELLVWAVFISAGFSRLGEKRSVRETILSALTASVPFFACVAVRVVAFGRAAPLSIEAKPSDLAHGAAYVFAALLVTLTPFLVLSPRALWKTRGAAGVIVGAFVAHTLVVAAVGGDWMPYARLFVPIVPSLLVAFVELLPNVHVAWSVLRLAAATLFGVVMAVRAAPSGRGVGDDRLALIERARPALLGVRVVAALDIGWLSAATDARIIDLAGLTDPTIAFLPGGHTSKRVSPSMLLERSVDCVLVYSDVRAVESRLLASPLFDSHYVRTTTLPLGQRGAFYAVYMRRDL
jgi:hypothetical protein